jgi:uncharacterized membrane protein YccC
MRIVVRGQLIGRRRLSEIAPDWLAEVVRSTPAPVPWVDMARAVLAIAAPLGTAFVTGHRELGLLPALGGQLSIMIDDGGPYLARVRRVSYAAVFGGAAGLGIGSFIHSRGWVAVVVLAAVAGVAALLTRLGGTGTATGMQLFIYSALGLSPVGALRPLSHTALQFVAGVAWSLLLLTPSWLLAPRAAEQRLVAAVYHAIAEDLRAIHLPQAATTRRAVTAALNAAYGALVTECPLFSGRNRRDTHLTAILNVSNQMTEAVTAPRSRDERPPPSVTETIHRMADAIENGPPEPRRSPPLPLIPPRWSDSPDAVELHKSIVALGRTIAGNWEPSAVSLPTPGLRERLRNRIARVRDELTGGRIARNFMIRLMACAVVAVVLSEILPIQRSYWTALTIAIVLRPGFGSVLIRSVQQGIGTIVGAAFGAVILAVVPYGPLLLIPFGVVAALLPYGKSRNFGLAAAFLTLVIVLLVDLLIPTGWWLAGERAIDTTLACGIVLVVGYLPWPKSWYAHLSDLFTDTLRVVADYMEEALAAEPSSHAAEDERSGGEGERSGGEPGARPAQRSRLRRHASQALADLRAEFQRTMSEPTSARRRAAAWWPALASLEELIEAITVTVLSISEGRTPAPPPESAHQLTRALCAVADAITTDTPPPTKPPLPSDEELEPVTAAVRSVLGALTPSEHG